MNKGFAYYFRQAFKMASKAIYRNKNVLVSALYFCTSLVACLTVVFAAAIPLANVRQAKICKNQQTVDVAQSFTKASRKSFWTMVVAFGIELLIYLGGLLMLGVVCAAIFAVGLAISQFIDARYFALVCVIFAIPDLLIIAVYSIIVLTVFSPTAYVIDTNPDLSAGDVVSVCVSSMKSRGKFTVLLCVFVPVLLIGLIASVLGGGFAAITLLTFGTKFFILATVLWSIVTAVVLGLTVPLFIMVKNTSLVLLFEDIALDPANARRRTAGINIKRIDGAKLDREEAADNLEALFDKGIDAPTPTADELARKRKKHKKQYASPAAKAPQPQEDTGFEETVFEEIDEYPEDAVTEVETESEGNSDTEPEAAPEYSDGE
ncbi:MAG: DUF975 family protein [Clostridia bacterium]|nr:DUF975 family protein [Clostridia bacterium]